MLYICSIHKRKINMEVITIDLKSYLMLKEELKEANEIIEEFKKNGGGIVFIDSRHFNYSPNFILKNAYLRVPSISGDVDQVTKSLKKEFDELHDELEILQDCLNLRNKEPELNQLINKLTEKKWYHF